MVNIPSNPAMVPGSGRLPHKAPLALAVCVCLAMYAFDLAVLHLSPTAASFYTANFAIPFDLMVCVPLVFYLLFVRRRGITPIAVLPVIYLGGLASSAVALPGVPSALPALFSAALVVDAVVLVREIPRLVRAFREGYHTARKTGAYPIEWFTGAFEAAVPSRAAARVAATEIAMWYYLLFSWRRMPVSPQGKEAFSYHKSSGFVALIGVILAMGAVEIVVVHLLVAQYSAVAAAVISVLSVYCLSWVASFARAVVASPLLLGGGALTVVWGFLHCEHVPLGSIERVTCSDPGFGKRETLDLATMGARPCWVVLKEPRDAAGIFGASRQVRAIKLSPDDLRGFACRIEQLAAANE